MVQVIEALEKETKKAVPVTAQGIQGAIILPAAEV